MFAVVSMCLLASAMGFLSAPSNQHSRTMSLKMAEMSKSVPFLLKQPKLDGTLAGDEGFDPLGLSNTEFSGLGIDLYWMREAELKHCRVGMLAFAGLLFQELGVVFPGLPHTSNQVTAFWECVDKNPGPIFAAFIFLGIVEMISGIAVTEGRKSGDRAPGDFGFNPLNFGNTPATQKDLALKEIRNGRLAMLAAAGLLATESLYPDKGIF